MTKFCYQTFRLQKVKKWETVYAHFPTRAELTWLWSEFSRVDMSDPEIGLTGMCLFQLNCSNITNFISDGSSAVHVSSLVKKKLLDLWTSSRMQLTYMGHIIFAEQWSGLNTPSSVFSPNQTPKWTIWPVGYVNVSHLVLQWSVFESMSATLPPSCNQRW